MKMNFIDSIIGLLYPSVCAACGNSLFKWENLVCTRCRNLLPKTGYELNEDNPLARMFYGKVRLQAVMACFFFSKEGKVQHLIHELKYKGNKEAGVFLGQEIGKPSRRRRSTKALTIWCLYRCIPSGRRNAATTKA